MSDLYDVAVDVRWLVDGKIEQEREIEQVIDADDLRGFLDDIRERVCSGGFAGMQVTIESNAPHVLDARALAASPDAATWKDNEMGEGHGL